MSERNPLDYITPYKAQIAAAKQRNLEWNLTFDEWYEWWGDDIDNRGIKPDSLVMALHDKSRGFCLDNIYKITKAELTMKVIQTGTKMMRPVHTPAGDFPSIASAGRHHGMQSMQVIYRINKPKHVDWYYIDKKGEQ
jgi:hypothetical protein